MPKCIHHTEVFHLFFLFFLQHKNKQKEEYNQKSRFSYYCNVADLYKDYFPLA